MLKVQKLLHICSEHFAEKEPKEVPEDKDKEKKEDPKPEPGSLKEPGAHQAFAVLGLALISLGEGIGAEMALRMCNHFVSWLHCTSLLRTACVHSHPTPPPPAPVWGSPHQKGSPPSPVSHLRVQSGAEHHGHPQQVLPRQRPGGGLQCHLCYGHHRGWDQQRSLRRSFETAGPVLLQRR